MAEIELKNGYKTYTQEDGSEFKVLDDIDVVAKDGNFTCVLGPSGCGKSTLLDCMVGLEDLDGGELHIHNKQRNGDPIIGYVFQDPRLLNWKTVAGNIKFAMRGIGIPEEEWDERIDKYLEFVGLSEFKEQHPLYLSGGQRQRVAVARALALEPDVLLMDEPFSALDEITARKLREDTLEIAENLEQTILFVTHNAKEAAFLSQQVVVLSDRPAKVKATLENPLDYPRDLESEDLLDFEREIVTRLKSGTA